MYSVMNKSGKYLLIALLVILIDQASKLLVYQYMVLNEEINVIGDWFRLHYLLNPGMAFGIELKIPYGKMFLTLFRVVATVGIGIFLHSMARSGKTHPGFLVCLALILGGAVGNAIDSIFYGVLLEGNMIPGSPTPWFHGRVIDMLFFPLFYINVPEFVPFGLGGNSYLFFSPVFNIADSSIFVGVFITLLFQRRFFPKEAAPSDDPHGNQNSPVEMGQA